MQDELQAILENPCVLTILNNMTEYVYIVDEQGCLQFINPAVEAFENLTNSEVKGKHIKELYTQGESPTLKALYEQKTIPEHENIYMLDGKQYHQLAKSFPLFAGEKLLGVCTVQRDMTLVSQVLSDNTALQKNQQKNPKAKKKTFDSLIGEHPAFQRSIELAKNSAVNDVPILLSGFTGSGKEVFAQAIHNSSPRKINHSLPSTAPPFLTAFWKGSSSERPREPLPGLWIRSVCLNRPKAEHYFWMKSTL